MTESSTKTYVIGHCRARYKIVFAAMLILSVLNGPIALAAVEISADYCVATAGDKFADTWQFSRVFKFQRPRRLRARHLKLVIGTPSTAYEDIELPETSPAIATYIARQHYYVV